MTNPANSGQGFWEPSPWYLAQTIHALAGALIVFAGSTHGWLAWSVFLALVIGAAVKEFGLDLSPFEGDTLAGSTWDFAFYVVGGVGGWLATFAFWWGAAIVIGAVLAAFAVDLWNHAKLRDAAGKWVPWRDALKFPLE